MIQTKKRRYSALAIFVLLVSIGAYPVSAEPYQQGSQDKGMQRDGMMQPHGTLKPSVQGSAPIFIGPASLMRIQQRLSAQGYEMGQADGIWGRSTAQAVRDFQQSQGLEPTGKIDIETVQALGLSEILAGGASETVAAEQLQRIGRSHGVHLYVSPSNLARIQETLQQEGYEVGSADGIWGPRTRSAIQQFQRDKGMTPTGNIEPGVLDHLGLGQITAALNKGAPGETATAQQAPGGQTGLGESAAPEARGYFGQERQGDRQGRMGTQDRRQAMRQGAPLFAGPELMRQIQQALSDAGHNPGSVDGTWSQDTQAALRAYQQQRNLAPTGNLTIGTVHELLGGFDVQNGSGMRQPGEMQQPQPPGMEQRQPGMQQEQPRGMQQRQPGMRQQSPGMGGQGSPGMETQPNGRDSQRPGSMQNR